MTDNLQDRYGDIAVRNQAIRACLLCDPAGYLPTGHLCTHDEPVNSPERAAAKARARQAVEDAQAKSKYKPAPEPDRRPIQEPWPEETPT